MADVSGATAGAAGPSAPIALDAMGGDHAPLSIVRGAMDYARETGRTVFLVGRPAQVNEAVATVRASWTARAARVAHAPVEVVPAEDVIGFGEKIASIRRKRDSSIHVGTRLVRDGRACAFVSAGHTGAVMAIAKVMYGVIEGVERPALPAPMPRPRGPGYTVLVDAGANLDCRPEHLEQFAVMGNQYSQRVLGASRPRVALLSIGEEDSKGNNIGREAARVLRATPINFIGNVEGYDLFSDKADVVVCDGFVGNVALKVAEGLVEALGGLVKVEFRRTPWRRLGAALLLWPALRPIRKKADYAEVGGVPLLGLKKVAVVAHGRSTPKAIKNALRAAAAAESGGMLEMIAGEIAALHETQQRLALRVGR